MPGPESAAREPAAETARPALPAAVAAGLGPGALPTPHARAMALQRSAGNAAVAALARRATTQKAPQTLLQRRRAAPKPTQQNNPPWAKKGLDNPSFDCTPMSAHDAEASWSIYAWLLPDKITERCGCSAAGDGYAEYLEAKGPKHTIPDGGNCISEQLAQDELAHVGDKNRIGPEQRLVEKWQARERAFIWAALPPGTREAEIDLIDALKGNVTTADPSKLVEEEISNELTYRRNTLAGGLLFGSGTADHIEADSEYGFDTRHVRGTIKLKRTDDGGNPDWMTVEQTLTFHYRIHDGLDFCPGNTLTKDDWSVEGIQYNMVLSDLSRLEASGMARDVEYTVSYHRTRTLKGEVRRPQ